jgi:putative NADH-flavin reductase
MKVALLGATRFVGSALLKEALDRGHIVTAIVRHPEKLENARVSRCDGPSATA